MGWEGGGRYEREDIGFKLVFISNSFLCMCAFAFWVIGWVGEVEGRASEWVAMEKHSSQINNYHILTAITTFCPTSSSVVTQTMVIR